MRRHELVNSKPGETEHVTSDRPIDIFELTVTNYFIDLVIENTNYDSIEFARSSEQFESCSSL